MKMALLEASDPEQPIVEAVRQGDRKAFEELMRRHNGWIRGVVYGVLGERDGLDDVVQQVWTAVWRRIAELRDAGRWRPWVYRLSRNAALDAGRDATRRRRRNAALPGEPPTSASTTPDAELVGSEQHREVLNAIQELPVLYREPFVLRHLQGWSYRQIAEVMDMPVDSVETRLVRARRMLRESLKEKLGLGNGTSSETR